MKSVFGKLIFNIKKYALICSYRHSGRSEARKPGRAQRHSLARRQPAQRLTVHPCAESAREGARSARQIPQEKRPGNMVSNTLNNCIKIYYYELY